MGKTKSIPSRAELRDIAEDALRVLRADPRRWRTLLRSLALQADEVAVLLDDAGHEAEGTKVRWLAKSLRTAALLPAAASVGIARKLLKRALSRADSPAD